MAGSSSVAGAEDLPKPRWSTTIGAGIAHYELIALAYLPADRSAVVLAEEQIISDRQLRRIVLFYLDESGTQRAQRELAEFENPGAQRVVGSWVESGDSGESVAIVTQQSNGHVLVARFDSRGEELKEGKLETKVDFQIRQAFRLADGALAVLGSKKNRGIVQKIGRDGSVLWSYETAVSTSIEDGSPLQGGGLIIASTDRSAGDEIVSLAKISTDGTLMASEDLRGRSPRLMTYHSGDLAITIERGVGTITDIVLALLDPDLSLISESSIFREEVALAAGGFTPHAVGESIVVTGMSEGQPVLIVVDRERDPKWSRAVDQSIAPRYEFAVQDGFFLAAALDVEFAWHGGRRLNLKRIRIFRAPF